MEPNQPRPGTPNPQSPRGAPAPDRYARRIDCSPADGGYAGRNPPPHGGGRPGDPREDH